MLGFGGGTGPLGLLVGAGELPLEIARAARRKGDGVVVVGVRGHTDPRIEEYALSTHYLELGQIDALPGILKREKVRQVAIAGGLPKKKIYSPELKLDGAARSVLGRTGNRGDDHILRAFALFLRVRCGVAVVDTRKYLAGSIAEKGAMTRRAPDEAQRKDLELGRRVARATGKMDIGQTVVVKQGVVLAVEALEGTDAAIRRGAELGLEGTVVVKIAKPNQDLRFDLPCAGLGTVESLRSARCSVLGLEAGKTLMLSKAAMIQAADDAGIAIVGL